MVVAFFQRKWTKKPTNLFVKFKFKFFSAKKNCPLLLIYSSSSSSTLINNINEKMKIFTLISLVNIILLEEKSQWTSLLPSIFIEERQTFKKTSISLPNLYFKSITMSICGLMISFRFNWKMIKNSKELYEKLQFR